jgi:3',5'-cyclic AMP phosphodiesterase CpdA
MFTLPQNGPKGLEETAYWFDYQGVRFVSLNSNKEYFVQAEWLNRVLSDNPQKWTILTFHHPLFSSKEGRDNPLLRAAWQPVFDLHKVDLVLQGHDHTYARTGLLRDQNVPTGLAARSPQAGTVYVVSVSGPKQYDLGRRPFMHRAAEDTQLYQIISIDGDELKYEARTAIGELYDGFTLKKREGQPNELIDQIPNTPERLRSRLDKEAQ